MSKILIDGYEVPLECMYPDMTKIPESVTTPPGVARFMHERGLCGKPIEEVTKLYNEDNTTENIQGLQ